MTVAKKVTTKSAIDKKSSPVVSAKKSTVKKTIVAMEKVATAIDKMLKPAKGFEKGTGCFPCRVCTRQTRTTDNRDASNVGLCPQCWEIAGIENQILDGGYDGPAEKRKLQLEIQDYQNIIIAKGGKIAPADLIVVDAVPVKEQLTESLAHTAPKTPLTKLLTDRGFVYAKSEAVDEQNTAHGYAHADGSAAMFVHANISERVNARWILVHDFVKSEGKTAQELATALVQPEALPANVVSALDMLRKATKQTYKLASLAGDDNYTVRVQLLKKLRNTDKVLAKDTGIKQLVTLFHTAMDAKTPAEFEIACAEHYRISQKVSRITQRIEKAETKAMVKAQGGPELIHDGKPVLPGVKKLSNKKQQEADEKTKALLARQIAAKRKQEEYTPIAVPRPEAQIAVDLNEVHLLEDPANGIVLLKLERTNSQGAICVYNNGVRVAVGVIPTETLNLLRPLVTEDLVRDINHFLHPITAGVIVTPQAEQQLTAVLTHCKEITDMANEKAIATKKFAAPKSTNGKKEQTAAASKPAKAAKTPKAPKESTRVKVVQNLDAVVTLVKKPGEGDKLAKRDKVIVEILATNGKKLALKDLFKHMKKAIGGDRTMESIWAWHGSPKQALISGGFVSVK